MLPGASVTVRVRWLSARRVISTNRLRRSTRVIRALRPPAPMTGSPSQCPGTAPSSASGGRRPVGGAPVSGSLPLGSGFSGWRGAGDAAGASGAQGLFHPQLGAQAAGALDAQGLVDLLANRGACSHHRGSRTAGGRRSARGPAPIPRAGRRPARAGPGRRPVRGSWGGPRAPGPRPVPPRGGRPRPTPAPRRISRDTVCRHRPIRRAMRAAQVPLRQARG